MRKQFDKQKAITKAQVDKAYKEFQEFMKTPNMPPYKFQYIRQNGTTIAEERYENNRYNLIIADTLCTIHKYEAKSILFHEFTHIWDSEQLTNIYKFAHDDRKTPYVYKEIHAEQVKTLYLLGCKNIDDLENVDKTKSNFWYRKNSYNIYDYLIAYKEELKRNIELIEYVKKNSKKINLYEFSNILNRIFYYIGTASIYIKYCDMNAYDEIDIKFVYDYYGYGTNLLLKVFVDNAVGYHTKELIEAMAKLRLLIIKYYGDELKLIDDLI